MWRQPPRLSSRAQRGSVCKFARREQYPYSKRKRDVAEQRLYDEICSAPLSGGRRASRRRSLGRSRSALIHQIL